MVSHTQHRHRRECDQLPVLLVLPPHYLVLRSDNQDSDLPLNIRIKVDPSLGDH